MAAFPFGLRPGVSSMSHLGIGATCAKSVRFSLFSFYFCKCHETGRKWQTAPYLIVVPVCSNG